MPTRTPSSRLLRSALSSQHRLSQRVASERAPEPLAPPATPGVLSLSTATARLAYDVLAALDLDGDGRLTARDAERARELGLRFAVDLELGPGVRLELAGAERLSHAADVLAEEILEGRGDAPGLPVERMLVSRTDALRRLLDQGWDGLVRRSDRAEDLKKALQVMPVKDPEGRQRVYVPARDRKALKRLRAEARRSGGLEMVPLQKPRGAGDWEALMRQPGMLYLPRPYIVPG
ncbi:MAG TPA: trehalase, partial [Archangium sp.]